MLFMFSCAIMKKTLYCEAFMKITFPGISQADFDYAIDCLEVCKKPEAKKYGFSYPYFAPGGMYGAQWWQLDSSLALCGYKWIDKDMVEASLQNFVDVQKDDGRICLYGADVFPNQVAGGNFSMQNEGVSSLPKLFDSAYQVLKGSQDRALKEKVYTLLKRYLDWWFSARQDEKTGLITAVFEETFIPYLRYAGEYAAVDTNVEVAVGCHVVELLAEELGYKSDAAVARERFDALKCSINKYLWNDEAGAYFAYYVKEEKHDERLMVSAFYPLRLKIAPPERRTRLISLMTDDSHFNWDTTPLTSVSKRDKIFVTTRGGYQGNASWSGNVWTLCNEMVIRGLLDCGEDSLAANLALKTVRAFNHNCAEFINPFDRSGHGVIQYAWSASQYLEILIEVIFGAKYSAGDKFIPTPHLCDELMCECIALENIRLPDGSVKSIFIENGVARVE